MKSCPPSFPAGFYWYGGKRCGPGCPPKWVLTLLDSISCENNAADKCDATDEDEASDQPQEESVTETQTQPTTGTTEPPVSTSTGPAVSQRYNLRSRSRRRSGRTQKSPEVV